MEVAANYSHSLTKGESSEGSIGVAVMGAQIAISHHGDRSTSDTGNLTLTARYSGVLPVEAAGG